MWGMVGLIKCLFFLQQNYKFESRHLKSYPCRFRTGSEASRYSKIVCRHYNLHSNSQDSSGAVKLIFILDYLGADFGPLGENI